jgi:hypothetical protein
LAQQEQQEQQEQQAQQGQLALTGLTGLTGLTVLMVLVCLRVAQQARSSLRTRPLTTTLFGPHQVPLLTQLSSKNWSATVLAQHSPRVKLFMSQARTAHTYLSPWQMRTLKPHHQKRWAFLIKTS